MPNRPSRSAGAGPLLGHLGGPSCSCYDCELVRHQQEVHDLLLRLDQPFSLGRVCAGLFGLVVAVTGSVVAAARRLLRQREDDEWDPY